MTRDDEIKRLAREMNGLGTMQIILTRTVQTEVDAYELAVLQGKDPKVIEDHYLRCQVAFENLLDNKRALAEVSRKWALAQSKKP